MKKSLVFFKLIKWLSNGSMYISYFFVLAMAAMGTLDAVMTHFLGRALTGSFELSSACLAATAFLGLPYAQQMGKHITVDIITSRFSENGKRISSLLGLIVSAVFLGFLAWRMGILTFESIAIWERDSGPLPFPVYIFKALALFGIFAATLVTLGQILELFRKDQNRAEAGVNEYE